MINIRNYNSGLGIRRPQGPTINVWHVQENATGHIAINVNASVLLHGSNSRENLYSPADSRFAEIHPCPEEIFVQYRGIGTQRLRSPTQLVRALQAVRGRDTTGTGTTLASGGRGRGGRRAAPRGPRSSFRRIIGIWCTTGSRRTWGQGSRRRGRRGVVFVMNPSRNRSRGDLFVSHHRSLPRVPL